MELSNAYNLFNQTELLIGDTIPVTLNCICENNSKVLIINSAGVTILGGLLEGIFKRNLKKKIYILTHERDIPEINYKFGETVECIRFSFPSFFDVLQMDVNWELIKFLKFDWVIITYNNHIGIGYENVEEIVAVLGLTEFVSYNCYNEIRLIKNLSLHIHSLKLYKELCHWIWDVHRTNEGEE